MATVIGRESEQSSSLYMDDVGMKNNLYSDDLIDGEVVTLDDLFQG